MIGRRALAGAGLLALAFVAGCKVDQAAFDNRIFACDPSAKDPGCGNDSSGKPMVCYAASLLDGTDFCAADCGPVPMSLADGNVCVEGNATLKFCDPSAGPTSCGQSNLGCLRTDVNSEEGVCTTMTPCTADKDCTNPVRSTCASTFLNELYANNTTLESNSLYCLQKNCQSGASSCSPGQSCLPLLVPAAAHAPDICVPNCDSQGNCPPNHACFQKISGPANPAICIPGLLGFICEADIDCLVGKCLSDGDPDDATGLKLCTIPCGGDSDCSIYDSAQGDFTCLAGSTGVKHCATPNAYRGNSCHTNDDCMRDVNTVCVYQNPPTSSTDLGSCLRSCGATTDSAPDCSPRAGVGETCLPFFTPAGAKTEACYPGFFPYPCLTPLNCVGDLTCFGADTTKNPAVIGNCTILCATTTDPTNPDADCDNDPWTPGSFCETAPNSPTGVCAPLLAAGKDCQSNNQCQSKLCQPPADGGTSTAPGTCAESPL